jgi:hypothetical protein
VILRSVYLVAYCGAEKIAMKVTERRPGQWTTEPEPPVVECVFGDHSHQLQRWTREEFDAFNADLTVIVDERSEHEVR